MNTPLPFISVTISSQSGADGLPTMTIFWREFKKQYICTQHLQRANTI